MSRRVPAIAGGEQNPSFGSRLAKGAAVLSARQPGEGGRSSARRNPCQCLAVLGHERGKLAKISRCRLLRLSEDNVSLSHGDLRQHFAGGVVGDGKNRARIPV